jgi:hypothetical protein
MVDLRALHAPLRPKRSRAIAIGVAVFELLMFAVLIVAVGDGLGGVDRLGFVFLAVALAWFLWRLASVAAIPGEAGLVVRNVLLTRELSWAQIVSVRFGGGNPWVLLDLDDGETLSVMGIQRSDGARAVSEARRLATLVEFHSRTERND